ncbi:MAG: ceramidase [Myxococcaceae bacterium]
MFSAAGTWGAPTSTVDWCEANYALTPYVAELFNTLSSVAILVAGLLGVARHWKILERRFLFAFVGLALVGVGSVAFHGTLRFELQMLDELPMLYLVILMVYILVERGPQRRLGLIFPAGLAVYAIIATYLCAFTRGPLQFWIFQVGFGSLEFFSLVNVYWVQRKAESAAVRRLYSVGMGAYAIAILGWFVDLRFCAHLSPYLQLHACCHVLVSIGFYALLLVIAHERLRALGHQPYLLRLGLRARQRSGAHGSPRSPHAIF